MANRAITFTQSFQAASAMPVKLLQCKNAVVNGHIQPIHIQLIPTNRCNANCEWCSCRNVDRKEELGNDELWSIASTFSQWGAKAVTITGGGEPTLHPGLPRLIANMARLGYKIGLVTNGIHIPKPLVEVGQHITWIRVSSSSKVLRPVAERAAYAAQLFPTTDIGISYTVTADVDLVDAKLTADTATCWSNITHVRYVQDLTDLDNTLIPMRDVQIETSEISPKLIYQRRNEWTRGRDPCYISLLKPLIAADGHIYPCCGIQYAGISDTEPWTLPIEARMCHWSNFDHAIPFNGLWCAKCYYDDYNKTLKLMTAKIGHREFI